MSRFPAVGGGGGEQPIASKDRAETFSESDVTVTGIDVTNESLGLTSGSVSRGPDDTSFTDNSRRGLAIEPNGDIAEITANISANTNGVTTGYVTESDGTVLGQSSISNGSFTISGLSLSQGTTYLVVADADGADYTVGHDDSETYPISGDPFSITGGVFGGTTIDSGNGFTVRSANAGVLAASGTVEWPYPNDVYRWDAATFTSSEDGETVDVYIDESTDGGSTWTTIAGPISRGQDISAAPDSRCRFRVELSRSDTANNPTLDSIYRRWVV